MAAVLAPAKVVNRYLEENRNDGEADCIATQADRTLVLYQESTGNFERISRLSKATGAPTFGLHIHDDDLWMYCLYSSGDLVDQFNPIPDYWKDIPVDEKNEWKGNPDVIVQHWSGLKKEEIEKYLIFHDTPGVDSSSKAYPTDEFEPWDAWQVSDFLSKLGTPYPDE